jgi:anti-sigma B factor antagonist
MSVQGEHEAAIGHSDPRAWPIAERLAVETRSTPDEMVVAVRGELDLATAPAFRRRLLELVALPIHRLTVDLTELAFVDSSGLVALVAGRAAAVERNVAFALDRVPRQARLVIELAGMKDLFALPD